MASYLTQIVILLKKIEYSMRYGVDLGYMVPTEFHIQPNWPSGVDHYEPVQAVIKKDVRMGSKVGTCLQPPFHNFIRITNVRIH